MSNLPAENVTIPREPTLEMCIAYMKAIGFSPRDIEAWKKYLEKNKGGPHECGFVGGLRAAIAVGAGFPLDQVKRGGKHDCFKGHGAFT